MKQGASPYVRFNNIINLLDNHNIFCGYHVYNNLKYGDEKESIFFMHHKIAKGHHKDYIFASNDIIERMESFDVGEHKDWAHISDHVPLNVRLE